MIVVEEETWLLLLRRFTCCFCSACVDQGVLHPADGHGEASGGDGDSADVVVVSQMLTKEYYTLQMAMEKRVVEMETQLMLLFLRCWPRSTTPCRWPWRSEWWRWRLSWCCCCSSDVDQGVLRPADSHGEASGGDGDSAVREDRQAGHLWAAGERNGWCHTAGSWRLADALLAGRLVWLVDGWSGWRLVGGWLVWLMVSWLAASWLVNAFISWGGFCRRYCLMQPF